VYLPLSCLFGILAFVDVVRTLWYFGHISNFSSIFLLQHFVSALVIGIPALFIPAIARPSRIPASVRLTFAHILFSSVCLLVPVLNTLFVWHRNYREVNGFLLAHEFFPKSLHSETAAGTPMLDSFSICDDEFFYLYFVFDHALNMASRFILPMMIELPPVYFSITVIAHTFLLWVSAFRISNVYIATCSNHPASAAGAAIAKLYLPLGHMIHLACFLTYIFTSLFISSRNREQNKKWTTSLLREAYSTTRVHLMFLLKYLLRWDDSPALRPTGTFWSRTEFLYSKKEEPPLLLPAGVGIAFKVSQGLKEFGLYVWALSLPVYFTVFEILRVFTDVDPHICRIVHLSSWKCFVLLVGLCAPHFLLAKAIHQGRVRKPWLVSLGCFAIIIMCVLFFLPGTTGSVWNRNFRFLPYLIASNQAPSCILRAISHFASSTFIVIAFIMLQMYQHPPRPSFATF
jgi:hypothetical protein